MPLGRRALPAFAGVAPDRRVPAAGSEKARDRRRLMRQPALVPCVLRLLQPHAQPLAQSLRSALLRVEPRRRVYRGGATPDRRRCMRSSSARASARRQRAATRLRLPAAARRGRAPTSAAAAGRRRCARVGDEIAYREVGLVADAADDRDAPTRTPRARRTSSLNAHRSSIEPPPRQTIRTSTSRVRVGGRDRRGDLVGGAPRALYRRAGTG